MDGRITVAGTIKGSLSDGTQSISGGLSTEQSLDGEITAAEVEFIPTYEGAYGITPTQAAQTIPISGLVAAEDIVIEPIPSNYGLISWNGSTLTVS